MPEKDPTTWGLATWLLALGMDFGGGAVNWYAKAQPSILKQCFSSNLKYEQ